MVFLSHASEDGAIVRAIAPVLEDQGWRTWYYERDLEAGVKHMEATERAIEASALFVVVVSAAAFEADYVFPEMIHAAACHKPFAPVLDGLTYEQFEQRKQQWVTTIGPYTASSWDATNPRATCEQLDAAVRRVVARAEHAHGAKSGRDDVAPVRRAGNHPGIAVSTQNLELRARDLHESYDHVLAIFIANVGDRPLRIRRALFRNRVTVLGLIERESALPVYSRAFKDVERHAYELKFGPQWYDPQVDLQPGARVMTYLPLSRPVPDRDVNRGHLGEVILRVRAGGAEWVHRVRV
jgi:hypothetical protein